jgi:hypothetical protein
VRRLRLPGEPRPLPGSRPSLPYRWPRVEVVEPEVEPEVEPDPASVVTPGDWLSFGGGDPSGLNILIPEPPR